MTFGRVTSQTARDLQFFWKKKKSTKVNTADAVNQEDYGLEQMCWVNSKLDSKSPGLKYRTWDPKASWLIPNITCIQVARWHSG